MGRMYSAASRVLIWLGSARMAARRLRDLQVHSIKDGVDKISIKKMMNDHCRIFVEGMIQCQWFTRLWVVQECLLSRSTFVMYGDGEVDVQIVLAAIRYLQESNLPTRTRYSSWMNLLDARIPTFLDALQATRGRRCSDPRDHIYGIIGLPYVQNTNAARFVQSIEPDYTKPVRHLFLEVAGSSLGMASSEHC